MMETHDKKDVCNEEYSLHCIWDAATVGST